MSFLRVKLGTSCTVALLFLCLPLLSSCSRSKSSLPYTNAGFYKLSSNVIELPGVVCVGKDDCRDYVSRWKTDTESREVFDSECKGETLLEGKACLRSGYGCVGLVSNEGADSSYSTISVTWGSKEECTGKVDTKLNEL